MCVGLAAVVCLVGWCFGGLVVLWVGGLAFGLFVGLVSAVVSFRFEKLVVPIFPWPADDLSKLILGFWSGEVFFCFLGFCWAGFRGINVQL